METASTSSSDSRSPVLSVSIHLQTSTEAGKIQHSLLSRARLRISNRDALVPPQTPENGYKDLNINVLVRAQMIADHEVDKKVEKDPARALFKQQGVDSATQNGEILTVDFMPKALKVGQPGRYKFFFGLIRVEGREGGGTRISDAVSEITIVDTPLDGQILSLDGLPPTKANPGPGSRFLRVEAKDGGSTNIVFTTFLTPSYKPGLAQADAMDDLENMVREESQGSGNEEE